jgi:hypothetical protein
MRPKSRVFFVRNGWNNQHSLSDFLNDVIARNIPTMTDNFIAHPISLILNIRKETAFGLNIGTLLEVDFGLVNSSNHKLWLKHLKPH